MTASPLNRYFDHTALKPEATSADIDALCQEAIAYEFFSVCINPCHIPRAVEKLTGHDVRVCTVVGFPLGAMRSVCKAQEAADAVGAGAQEVDMVLNIGWAREGRWDAVEQDIAAVRTAAGDALLKVILETCLLTDEQIEAACACAAHAGADYVKTSTGFSTAGATPHHVALMRGAVGTSLGVKASGGIRTLADARAMIDAGATRLGASAGVAIMEEQKKEGA